MSDPNPNNPGSPPASPVKPDTAVTSTPSPGTKPETAVSAVPAKPAAPPNKPPAAKPPAKGTPRRFVLLSAIAAPFVLAWITFTASMGLMFLGTLRFLFPNVLTEPPSKFKVGFVDSYEDGKVIERYKDQNAWIVRNDGKLYALSTTCTHLGCTPNWLEREQKFKCPCHGSGFYISGINFEGPAPRPLERWGVGIGDDGQIVVDKSKKFQQERGEWTNPESFIKV
jgi:cytochrome b6-f complex iron-sulfur subunit